MTEEYYDDGVTQWNPKEAIEHLADHYNTSEQVVKDHLRSLSGQHKNVPYEVYDYLVMSGIDFNNDCSYDADAYLNTEEDPIYSHECFPIIVDNSHGFVLIIGGYNSYDLASESYEYDIGTDLEMLIRVDAKALAEYLS